MHLKLMYFRPSTVMNTPLGRALDIVDDEGIAVWKANVEETIEEGDPAGEYAHTIGAWHGLSAPGDVTVRLFSAIPLLHEMSLRKRFLLLLYCECRVLPCT